MKYVVNVIGRIDCYSVTALTRRRYCEVCGQCDREDRLLLCDSFDQG